jgi:AbiV family abortive infection protein
MDVAAPDLLKGTWYSLEQCGRLLASAVALYREKDYSTAVGIAMFAREELGKHRLHRGGWKTAVDTGRLQSVEQVKKLCGDHIGKQKQGQMSVTLMPKSSSNLGTALTARATSRPGNPGFQAAEEVIQKALEAKAKHAPTERHEKRLEAFFVDLDNSGADWKRPSETISQEVALRELNDAANDYAGQWDRFSHTDLLEDRELAKELDAWTDKPALQKPIWVW